MALIVEDGSNVPGANTYVGLSNARDRAAILGVSLNTDDTEAELQLQRATIYIDNEYRQRFKGVKTNEDQALQWPRYDVYIDCYYWESDEIPQELIDSEIYAAAQLEAGESFYSNYDNKNVKLEEVVGAVKQEYFNNGVTNTQTQFMDVQNTIQVLLKNGGWYAKEVTR